MSNVGPRTLMMMAFDFGVKRIGVAAGNTLLRQAQPLRTVEADNDHRRFAQIERLLTEWQPQALVVGVPFHPDGAEHDNTRRARRFARQLHGRFRLPVHEVDERYTTTEALSLGARDADAEAAALILAQYFRQEKGQEKATAPPLPLQDSTAPHSPALPPLAPHSSPPSSP